MPYTPPSARSPAGSASTSPNLSRRSSYTPGQPHAHPPSSPRPDLPRSSSYLTRHRRTPSVKTASFATSEEPTPPGTADKESSSSLSLNVNGSLRQSPPPVTDEARRIPNSAVLSPPESTQNSSDDEEEKSRGRQQHNNIEELKAAIRLIEQNRSSSPNRQAADVAKANQALTLIMPDSAEEVVIDKPTISHIERHLSVSARKMMHVRSNTDSSVFIGLKSESNSEDESDEDLNGRKPPMLRKKSGELVRPALRPSSAKRRPSSMPGTPTFGKAVHFDSHLEHVRHFLQVDRPLAVSAGSSPVEAYESDNEFPFGEDESTRGPPFEWEIIVANFPADTPHRLSQPVRLERVFLSQDNKNLVGRVAVANLSFNKTIVARFTLDYWKTTSEVVAEYSNDVRRPQENDGYDRFNFSIKLADQANLEAKTMFFCVKYCVNGTEYWDNNNNTNFQVDFRKKAKPQNGKKGMQGAASRPANSLPRSNKKSPMGRPKALPPTAAFDDFSQDFDSKFNFKDFKQNDLFDDVPNPTLRLKGVKSAVSIPTDNSPRKQPGAMGNAFSNRYDFGASLSAAISAANTALGDRSGLPQDRKSNEPAPMTAPRVNAIKAQTPQMAPSTKGTDSPRPAGTEKPVLASQSYNELLDKYCFVRTKTNGFDSRTHS